MPYQLLVESVRDYAIFMLDPRGYIRSWNQGAHRLKGYEASEVIGRHFSVLYPPADVASGKPMFELEVAAREGRYEDEGWRVRKDGSRFWANVVITALRGPEGDLVGFAKVTRDLTERKLAEEEMRHSEERFRALVDGVRDYAIYMLDAKGRVVSWNMGAERMKGYRPEEVLGQHFSLFFPEDLRARHAPERELEQAAREGRFEEENWRVRKDGTRFWANVVLTPLRDSTGRLVGYAKVTRDLTEQKLSQEALRQSEERYRLLIEGVQDYAIFLLDPAGLVASWNPGAERLLGYAARDILGKPFTTFYVPEDRTSDKPERELREAREEGRYEEEGWRVREDGTRFWANVIVTPLFDAEGRLQGYAKVTRDLTASRAAEA
ncbi:MAG: PAS domain S-box protein, partial [Halobacteriales archaeon]|nr:PAS domain S-box protein [Halobacteriales archaeon]